MTAVAGWDVGGANLKVAVIRDGRVVRTLQLPCPLWTGLDSLRQALAEARPYLPAGDLLHAVTLTGELVDLFPDRTTGVQELLSLLSIELGPGIQVYAGPAGLLSLAEAAARPLEVASANWHASAALLARFNAHGVMVDVGSTTTDIVPVSGGRVLYQGLSDHQRLITRELIYSGVMRTPVMALARSVRVNRKTVPLMAELFATTADVFRLSGELPSMDTHAPGTPWDKGSTDHGGAGGEAADNGPQDLTGSARRLLRMAGLDLDGNGLATARALALQLREAQLRRLVNAVNRLAAASGIDGHGECRAPLIAAGTGRFLVTALAARLGRACIAYERICGFSGPGSEKEAGSASGTGVLAGTDQGSGTERNQANFAPAIAVGWMAEKNKHAQPKPVL